jgi:hypothetical protein
MFDDLIEIIFKNLHFKTLGPLLKNLTSGGENIASYYATCEGTEIDWKKESSIEGFLKDMHESALFINLKSLDREGIFIRKCGLAIYKNQDTIRLEVNFQVGDIYNPMNVDVVEALMILAQTIAKTYEIEDFFCGFEPAQDLETRLFTKNKKGPFLLKKR